MIRSLLVIFAALALASPAVAQQAVTCDQNAQGLVGDAGAQHNVTCPAGCNATVWGTGSYSDDSSVCTAAIHAGVLTSAGGPVVITISAGQEAYPATTQNGVTSSQWASWNRSFIPGPSGGTCANTCATAGDGECDDGGAGSMYALCELGSDCGDCGPRAAGVVAQAVECSTNAQGLTGDPGTHHTVACPAGCGSATIWGTGAYSDDSSVCSAAIHAGVLQAGGGTAVISIAPGQEAYPASTQNGVTSSQWGSWTRSFLVGPVGGTCENSCATAGDGECDDGGPGSLYALCGLGSDCNDCGPR